MKIIFKSVFLLLILLGSLNCKQQAKETRQSIAIIPQVAEINQTEGVFQINSKTKISCTKELKAKAEQLAALLRPATAYSFPISETNHKRNVISLVLDNNLNSLQEEAYTLEVLPHRINIKAASISGILYGIQSLRQLLPAAIERKEICKTNELWEIPCVSITDSPRFKWRGLMLDCSRTFWSVEYVKRTIRLMSLYKMNMLHLHLTDDQGWRIEIEKYPELTQKGAQFPEKWNEPKAREGFYSKNDIREIVDYATQHNVTIVPEIEMPGHTLAVLACYPELSCTGGPFEIHPFFKGPNVHEDIFCVGNEKTFDFIENVLSEVFEMFPSEYIHIGGDEAPKARWEACQKCQARLKEDGLKDEHELQSWFIKRIEKFVSANGKKLIGWDEIMEGGLSSTANVMYWRGWLKDVPEKVISEGNNIIMSPTSHCYFDYKYENISTMKAYRFNPVPDNITKEQSKNILGLQANFWSHIDRSEAGVDKQLFPRILSIAELGWSPENSKDSTLFKEKVFIHLDRLKELNVNYYPDSTIIKN